MYFFAVMWIGDSNFRRDLESERRAGLGFWAMNRFSPFSEEKTQMMTMFFQRNPIELAWGNVFVINEIFTNMPGRWIFLVFSSFPVFSIF